MHEIEHHHGQDMLVAPDGRLIYGATLTGGRGRINVGDKHCVQEFW